MVFDPRDVSHKAIQRARQPAPDPLADLTAAVHTLLEALHGFQVPAPQVHVPAPSVTVPPPDFSGVVEAIRQQTGLTGDRLAEAVQAVSTAPLQQIAPLLENLAAAAGQPVMLDSASVEALVAAIPLPSGGGGGPSVVGIKDTSGTKVDPATDDVLLDVKRGVTDWETRFDYDGLDADPSFVGRAPQGTATSSDGWVVERLSYDAGDRIARIEVKSGAWADRESLFD